MTEQEQKQLIYNRRLTEMKTLRKIERSNKIMYDNDRADYMNIITADSLEDAWDMYKWMDTASREVFMEVIR